MPPPASPGLSSAPRGEPRRRRELLLKVERSCLGRRWETRCSDQRLVWALSQRYGLPDRFLLHVGTIEPRKNLVRLLEALARLRRSEGLDHGLVLVGHRGWKDEEVFAPVERLALEDAAQFLGYVPVADLVALYNRAQALVYPSLYEGFGLPVLEAMACGTPVVASSSSSLREVAGSAAEFVDPNSVRGIAAGVRRVLLDADRREELRALGLAQAARFSWDTAAQQTRGIYEQVVAAGTA